ncbi:MAG: anti-sigma B factor antagonist [Pirellulaceae bacterium]|jgi:anti-sigma B factor antagonist
MKLATEVFGDVVVVHTPEELVQDHAADAAEFLTELQHSKIVVEMDGTDSIDSVGLASLLDVQDELQLSGGDLKIVTTVANTRKIFEITRLDQVIEVFADVVDAITSFK